MGKNRLMMITRNDTLSRRTRVSTSENRPHLPSVRGPKPCMQRIGSCPGQNDNNDNVPRDNTVSKHRLVMKHRGKKTRMGGDKNQFTAQAENGTALEHGEKARSVRALGV